MTTTTSRRITATLAGALISAGILAGAAVEHVQPRTAYLADYGSDISAENSEAHSEAGGVRHMGDHSDAPDYFKRMNGAGN